MKYVRVYVGKNRVVVALTSGVVLYTLLDCKVVSVHDGRKDMQKNERR